MRGFCHCCNTLTCFACDPWLSSDIPLAFLTSQLTIHRSPYSDNPKNNSTHFQVSLCKHCMQVTSNSLWHRIPFPLSYLHLESALLMSKLHLDPMMMHVLKDWSCGLFLTIGHAIVFCAMPHYFVFGRWITSQSRFTST